MRVVKRPQSFEAMQITDTTVAADFQALYDTVVPGGTATVEAFQLGGEWIVTTSEAPDWTGRFATGSLITYSAPTFRKLEPADDYAPYEDVYVTP